MHQQVGDKEYRVVFIFAHVHFDGGAVLLHHHAVEGQGKRHPLIFLDAAVIMGVQVGEAAVLIQGILLHIDSGAVDMGSQNVHALSQGLLPDLEHGNGLIHADAVYLVAFLQLPALRDHALQLPIPFRLDGVHDGVDALPLGLAIVQEFPVLLIQLLHLLKMSRVIGLPSYFSFHFLFLSYRRKPCPAPVIPPGPSAACRS